MSKLINVTFPDGSVKQFESGITANEIAKGISSSLAKKCIIAKYNNEFVSLEAPILTDGSIELVTGEVEGLNDIYNHSCAHLLANAIKELYPNAMFGVVPAIEEGFYYDMDLGDVKLNDEDLVKIEKKMVALVAGGASIVRKEVSKVKTKKVKPGYKKKVREAVKKAKAQHKQEIIKKNLREKRKENSLKGGYGN